MRYTGIMRCRQLGEDIGGFEAEDVQGISEQAIFHAVLLFDY